MIQKKKFSEAIAANISVVEGLIENRMVKYYRYDIPAEQEVEVDLLRGFVTVSISTSMACASFLFTNDGYVYQFYTSYNGAINFNEDTGVVTIKQAGKTQKIILKNNKTSAITVYLKVLNI